MKISTPCGLLLGSLLISVLGCSGSRCCAPKDWNSPVLETGGCHADGECARYGSVLSYAGGVVGVSESTMISELPSPPLAAPHASSVENTHDPAPAPIE